MRRIILGILSVVGAFILMLILAAAALTLSRSNPGIHPAFFFAACGVIYTLGILAVLSRF